MSGGQDEMIGRIVLGRYRIVWRLARGGMGVVYLARAEGAAGFVRPVVVKRILPHLTGDESMAKMFIREARILSNLRHPGIVGVLDFGQEDEAYIMVLDYVHGYHLGKWNRYVREKHGGFAAELAIHIVIQVLDALHYAHNLMRPDGKSLHIIHRDISPSNVLLDTDAQVKLVDFGIARMSGETQEYKTEDVTLKGKLPYLAPELFHGEPPTIATDVYSCGVLLHELLVGRNEFRSKEMGETLNKIFEHMPSKVASVRDDVPAGLDDIIHRAVAKKPAERFATAGELAQALREARSLSEGEAEAELARAIQRDFYGDLPGWLNLEPLETLDRSWRTEPPPAVTASVPVPVAESEPPTKTGVKASAEGSKTRQGLPAALVALAALAAVGAAGVVWFQSQASPSSAAPQFIVVDRPGQSSSNGPTFDRSPTPAGAVEPAASDAAPPDAGSGSQDANEADPDPREQRPPRRSPRPRRKRSGNRLTRAFAAKQAQIEKCFTSHAAELSGSPRIQIRFQVDEQGNVSSAQLSPASLQQTALGACLTRVARSTDFGKQPRPIAFSIPLTARRAR